MADKITSSEKEATDKAASEQKANAVPTTDPAGTTVDVPAKQDPDMEQAGKDASTAKKSSSKEVDHNSVINKALDSARDAMVESGMSEADADAFLSSARPSGVSDVVGNLADLQRSTGLPKVQVAEPEADRLQFAHKIVEPDKKDEGRKTF